MAHRKTPPSRFRSSPSESGFSLVELLIVVAIIGILAATTIPAYEKVRHKGKVSNLIKELNCVHLSLVAAAEEDGGYPDDLTDTTDLLDRVNDENCRIRVTPPKFELDYYWCIRFLPDGSPYITQCIDGLPPEDYFLGLRAPGLIDPATGSEQRITVSSFDGVRARTAAPVFPVLP